MSDWAGSVLTPARPTTAMSNAARDLVLLLARIGLGVLMVAHAKLEYDFAGGSIAGVGTLFQKSGVPLAPPRRRRPCAGWPPQSMSVVTRGRTPRGLGR
jgi:hypothetical protein